jgi:hypothetical protein
VAELAASSDGEAANHLGVSAKLADVWSVLMKSRYKILFLDVLFPMDLDKVIFVDAGELRHHFTTASLIFLVDQIVRTDMKELIDTDLHGRVYGFAPMGNDREEMEGFRFWKTGELLTT